MSPLGKPVNQVGGCNGRVTGWRTGYRSFRSRYRLNIQVTFIRRKSQVLRPVIINLDFGRLPAAEKASDINKHVQAVKKGNAPLATPPLTMHTANHLLGQKFGSPYIVVRQRQGDEDREGEDLTNNRIATFYFKSMVMRYLREVHQSLFEPVASYVLMNVVCRHGVLIHVASIFGTFALGSRRTRMTVRILLHNPVIS